MMANLKVPVESDNVEAASESGSESDSLKEDSVSRRRYVSASEPP